MLNARSTSCLRSSVAAGAIVLTFAACRAPSSAPETPQPVSHHDDLVTLVVSSDLGGELRPAGCRDNPLGGLARRAAYVNGVRAAGTTLYLEIGDILGSPSPPALQSAPPSIQVKRARLILERLQRAGLAAWTPGEADLSVGLEALRAVTSSAGVVTLAANLRDRAGRSPFRSSIVVDAKPLRIGLLGLLLTDASTRDRLRSRGATLVDPIPEARRNIAELKANGAQLVVALVHAQAGRSEVLSLVQQVRGLDWVLLGHPQSMEGPAKAEDVLGTRIFASVGWGISRVDLHVRGGVPVFRDPGGIGALRSRIRTTEEAIRQSVEGRSPSPGRLPELQRQLADEKKLLGLLIGRQATRSWFEAFSVPLDGRYPDDSPTLAAIDEFERTME
jgi:2',3'-cyclic-nucleotide 2'-phosphodiesterase (5'-nucleotidase family)